MNRLNFTILLLSLIFSGAFSYLTPQPALAQYVGNQSCVNSSQVDVTFTPPAAGVGLYDDPWTYRAHFPTGQSRVLRMPTGTSYPNAMWFWSYWNGDNYQNQDIQFSYTTATCIPPSATLYVRNLTTDSSWTTSNLTISPGQDIGFYWSSSYTSSCSGTNVSISGTSGTQNTVNEPSAGSALTYTLYCSGSMYGSVSRSITVTVDNPTPSCSISLSPNPINEGSSSTLSWSSSNASSFYIQNVGYVSASGSATVSPSETTSYAGSVTGTGGSASCTGDSNLVVNQSCPFAGSSVTHGQSVTAYLESELPYGSTCSSETRTCSDGTLSGTYQYSSCTVSEVPPPPTNISLSVTPSIVYRNNTATVTWSSEGADSCTVTGGGSSWSGTASSPSGETTNPIIGEVVYLLQCSNAGGTTSASSTVKVLPTIEET